MSLYVNANPKRIDTKHQTARHMKGTKSILYSYVRQQQRRQQNSKIYSTLYGYVCCFCLTVSARMLSSLVRMRMKSGKYWMWQSSSSSSNELVDCAHSPIFLWYFFSCVCVRVFFCARYIVVYEVVHSAILHWIHTAWIYIYINIFLSICTWCILIRAAACVYFGFDVLTHSLVR